MKNERERVLCNKWDSGLLTPSHDEDDVLSVGVGLGRGRRETVKRSVRRDVFRSSKVTVVMYEWDSGTGVIIWHKVRGPWGLTGQVPGSRTRTTEGFSWRVPVDVGVVTRVGVGILHCSPSANTPTSGPLNSYLNLHVWPNGVHTRVPGTSPFPSTPLPYPVPVERDGTV